MSHRKPAIPAATKADRHPQVKASHGTTAGATIAPTLAPELNRAVAKARSFRGNHSATALIAEGKLPPSPSPSATRAVAKPVTLPTAAWPIAAMLQAAMEMV